MDNSLTSKVVYVLRNFPPARDSDITLLLEVWRRFYPDLCRGDAVEFTDLYKLPREDNVKRIRAMLNHEGKFFPTDWEIAKQRGIEEERWRSKMGYPPKYETKQTSREPSYMDQEENIHQGQML